MAPFRLPLHLNHYQPLLPSNHSLPDTIALNWDEYVPVLSYLVSEIHEPVVDHVVSFVHWDGLHAGHTV